MLVEDAYATAMSCEWSALSFRLLKAGDFRNGEETRCVWPWHAFFLMCMDYNVRCVTLYMHMEHSWLLVNDFVVMVMIIYHFAEFVVASAEAQGPFRSNLTT